MKRYISHIPIVSVDLSPNNIYIATGHYNCVNIIRLDDLSIIYSFNISNEIELYKQCLISFSPDSNFLAIFAHFKNYKNYIFILDVINKCKIVEYELECIDINSLSFGNDINCKSNVCSCSFIDKIIFSPDGKYIVTYTLDCIELWNIKMLIDGKGIDALTSYKIQVENEKIKCVCINNLIFLNDNNIRFFCKYNKSIFDLNLDTAVLTKFLHCSYKFRDNFCMNAALTPNYYLTYKHDFENNVSNITTMNHINLNKINTFIVKILSNEKYIIEIQDIDEKAKVVIYEINTGNIIFQFTLQINNSDEIIGLVNMWILTDSYIIIGIPQELTIYYISDIVYSIPNNNFSKLKCV